MDYDDNTALLLKMEISRLVQFYNTATISQKNLIRRQLKLLRLLLKKNQYHLRKKCRKYGHCYTGWIHIPSKNILKISSNFQNYKLVRTCHLCGYSDVQKKMQYPSIFRK